MTFAEKAIGFFTDFDEPKNLPEAIGVINPYKNVDAKTITAKFFSKYFNDTNSRIMIFGINPGRFGGGVTGIPFTDPVALNKFCKIKNPFANKRELSSSFIYDVILEFGGCEKFYGNFFLSAVYPFALIKNGKNFNYYDSKELFNILKDDLFGSIEKQFNLGAKENVVISIGKKNAEFIREINSQLNLFGKIEYLEHPRFILQYRRKELSNYIEKYIKVLKKYS